MTPVWHFLNGVPQAPIVFGPLTIGATALTSTVPVLATDGTAAAPSYSFASAPTKGLYRVNATTIGLSGALTTDGNITAAGTLEAGAGGLYMGAQVFFKPVASGVAIITNENSNGFTRLILGTNDASGVALKKNGTEIDLVLGNDAGDANLKAGIVRVSASSATPAGGATTVRLVFGTTAGFGIYVGSGLPTVSAAQGSLYLRSDGSTTSTRLYVNTNGTTGWTAVTTAS